MYSDLTPWYFCLCSAWVERKGLSPWDDGLLVTHIKSKLFEAQHFIVIFFGEKGAHFPLFCCQVFSSSSSDIEFLPPMQCRWNIYWAVMAYIIQLTRPQIWTTEMSLSPTLVSDVNWQNLTTFCKESAFLQKAYTYGKLEDILLTCLLSWQT